MNAIRTLTLVLAAVFYAAISTGCGHQLFSNPSATSSRERIDKYYDGDSAIETTNSRRRSSDMGFGYPSGSGNEQ